MMTRQGHSTPVGATDPAKTAPGQSRTTSDPSAEPVSAAQSGASQSAFSVLVALRNDECAPAVIRLAEAMATDCGAHPELLYTIELPFTAMPESVAGDPTVMMAAELLDPELHKRDEKQLRTVLHLNKGLPATWPFNIEVGEAASCITQYARRDKVDMVLMGLRHHGPVGRAFGNDTLREVMALGDAPVLAVHPSTRGLPSTVVVAMDFSRSSIRAAHMALRVMKREGTMYLVFIEREAPDESSESTEGQQLIENLGVDAAFEQIISDLHVPTGITVKHARGRGDAVAQLALACERFQPDVLAMGKHRHGVIERLRLGSVTNAMIQDGRWSMLVTPPEM